MRISEIEVFTVYGKMEKLWHWMPEYTLSPLHIYSEFRCDYSLRPKTAEESGTFDISATYVEIKTDAGPSGIYGPLFPEQAFIILSKLKPFLLGRDPFETELLWDQMYRLDRHGRSGHMMLAISAVDNALWDLKGKWVNVPVYELLGEMKRSKIPSYCTINDNDPNPDQILNQALDCKRQGFKGQKWYFRDGPGTGDEGMRQNIELLENLRGALGEGYPLMIDCWMGWDFQYASSILPSLEEFDLTWLEEPLMPGHLKEYRKLSKSTTVPLASGEHLYTLQEVAPYIDEGMIAYLQCDPDWCGGITEFIRIVDYAVAHEIPVVPHAHSIAVLLQVAATKEPTECPILEFLPRHLRRQQFFHTHCHLPVEGYYTVNDEPGLGIVIDDAKVMRREPFAFSG